MRTTIIGLTCALTMTVPALADEQCPPLKIVSTVDVKTPNNAAAQVPVSISGQAFLFRLSTNGAQSSISGAAADKLKLMRRDSPVAQLNTQGNFSNTVAIAPDFQIGTARFGQVTLRQMINDPPTDEPQGWLGNDLLRNFDVELDFAAGKMNLISREHCAQSAVYWPSKTLAKVPMRVGSDNRIVFKMMLDGHELEATIDSGVGRSTLTRPVADSVFGLTESSPGAKPTGNAERFHYRFGKLSVEGLVVANPDITIVPDAAAKVPKHGRSHMQAEMNVHQAAPLRIGMSTLRQLHVYIDYHNQTLYFTPAKPDATSAEEPPAE